MPKSQKNQQSANVDVTQEPSITPETLANLSYEAAFAQLEEILQQLESDDLPLERSLTLYEQGMTLADHCTGMLDAATLRVQQWQDDGTTTKFDGWQEG